MIEDWVILGYVLVVHYEDVVEDKMKEMKRILEFLDVEPEEKRLSCLQESNVNIFKRKSHKLNSNPYQGPLSKVIKFHIDDVNDMLLKFNHPPVPYSKYTSF